MAIEFRRAERKKAKLRIGLFGPTGSGKTMSALKIASGFAPWEKICIIDTENGSADLYSHLGAYNVITIAPPYAPEIYVEAIKAAEKQGMEVIIVDSITHEWQGTGGMLEIADSMAASMRDGRQVWTKITPRHNKFIDALLQSPAHVICCGRSKTETILVESERNGRKVSVPEQIGLKAITREGFDYEMTVSFDVAKNHYATCSKDRTKGEDGLALFQDKSPRILADDVGIALKKWSESGKVDIKMLKSEAVTELRRLGFVFPSDPTDAAMFIREAIAKITKLDPMVDANYEAIVEALKGSEGPAAQEAMFGPRTPPEPPVTPPPAAPTTPTAPVAGPASTAQTATPNAPLGAGGNGGMGHASTGTNTGNPGGNGQQGNPVPVSQTEQLQKVFGDGVTPPPVADPKNYRARAMGCPDLATAKQIIDDMVKANETVSNIGMISGILEGKGFITHDHGNGI